MKTPDIHAGDIVINVKNGKQYVAESAPYESTRGIVVYVRSVSGKGAGHYMQASNLTVAEQPS